MPRKKTTKKQEENNKKIETIVTILCFLFLIVMILVILGNTKSLDNAIYEGIRNCKFLNDYFIFITKFGNTKFILFILFFFFLLLPRKHALLIWISAILSAGSNTIIKHIVRRPRPALEKLVTQGGYSFPSGHTMISIAVYGYLLYLAHTEIKKKWLRIGIEVLLGILIISIMISRIYVGVHYFTDVLGGIFLESAILISLITISKKYKLFE